jgi:hypothetical protein
MEYTNTLLEFTMSCIVCIGYIWGKIWIYYKVGDTKDTQTKKNRGVIRRGNEWDI